MVTHLARYRRLRGEGPLLSHTNWQMGKRTPVDHQFQNYCAMFVLDGKGWVEAGGAEEKVAGPFVLLARPGGRYRYGPDGAWDEYGFSFVEQPRGGFLEGFPEGAWAARSVGMLREQLAMAARLIARPAVAGVADQLDTLARLMLLTSLHGTGEDLHDDPERRLHDAEAWLRGHFHEPFRLGLVAKRFGFSVPAFRRLWRRHFAKPPWQVVLGLRIQEAQRLLENEPGLRINEIAGQCGFGDQRHFATVFKRHTGRTPSEAQRRGRGDGNC